MKVVRRDGRIRIGAMAPQNMDVHKGFAANKDGRVVELVMTVEKARRKEGIVQKPAQKRTVAKPNRDPRDKTSEALKIVPDTGA